MDGVELGVVYLCDRVLYVLVNCSRLHLQTTDNNDQLLSPPTQSLSFVLTSIVGFQI
jgi:hypothetical protein